MLKKLAEELKENRLEKGITLQQLFVKTRIDIKFLEAIENGNFDVLPEVYLRAFIKSYAAAVGMDEAATIKKFDAARAGKDYEDRAQEESHQPPKEEKAPAHKYGKPKEFVSIDTSVPLSNEEPAAPRSPKNNMVLLIGGILIFAAIIAAYLFFFHSSSHEIVTEKPYEEYIDKKQEKAPDSTAAATNNPQNTAGAPAAINDSLTLRIRTKDQTWVKVNKDNIKSEEFILQPNTEKAVRAKSNFNVTIGNSGSVELLLNNNPLNFSGGKGQVRVVKVDSSGLSYQKAVKPQKSSNE
ncbi:MAG: RodZ domain-containing protein [Ignavibacteriales bacterium]